MHQFKWTFFFCYFYFILLLFHPKYFFIIIGFCCNYYTFESHPRVTQKPLNLLIIAFAVYAWSSKMFYFLLMTVNRMPWHQFYKYDFKINNMIFSRCYFCKSFPFSLSLYFSFFGVSNRTFPINFWFNLLLNKYFFKKHTQQITFVNWKVINTKSLENICRSQNWWIIYVV